MSDSTFSQKKLSVTPFEFFLVNLHSFNRRENAFPRFYPERCSYSVGTFQCHSLQCSNHFHVCQLPGPSGLCWARFHDGLVEYLDPAGKPHGVVWIRALGHVVQRFVGCVNHIQHIYNLQ